MKRRAAQPPRGPYTTPLRQLRRRLTFVFTVLTGTVLTVFLAITLGLAQKQTQLSAQSMFDASVDTLIVTLQTGSVSDTALAQTEAADGLLIFITDNGTPLFFSGGWAPATPRGTLLERAAEAGLAEGVNMDAAPRSSVYASRVTVTVEGNAGEHYTAAVCSVPGQRGWYGLAVLRDDGPLRRTLTRQALLYAALLSGGLALLGAVNWFLAGRALRPTAEALQKQREFVAAAGHELRGPLAVVKTSLSAMQASPADTSQYLAAIGSESDRMARLVDDLLLLAGSDAGTWRMRMEPVDADALVIGAHEQFAPLVKARGLRLALDLPEETLPPLWGDAGRLRQLLLVFISNACAYAPAGSDVTLRARAEKGWVLLSVEDHGPGVPDAEKAHVFERFYRADKSRTGKEHYGLGLSVAQELAALHGGDILLTDTPSGGSTNSSPIPSTAIPAIRRYFPFSPGSASISTAISSVGGFIFSFPIKRSAFCTASLAFWFSAKSFISRSRSSLISVVVTGIRSAVYRYSSPHTDTVWSTVSKTASRSRSFQVIASTQKFSPAFRLRHASSFSFFSRAVRFSCFFPHFFRSCTSFFSCSFLLFCTIQTPSSIRTTKIPAAVYSSFMSYRHPFSCSVS